MAWGSSKYGATNAPTDKGYIKIYSNATAFESPHTVIEPSALRAAKEYAVE
jgi:hypothetical protein